MLWRGRIGKAENSKGERIDELGPLPELGICRDGRKVYVLLDSNVSSNHKVQQARRALIQQLIQQGADVLVADLPPRDGVNGPDDYIGVAGDDALASVLDAAHPSDPQDVQGGQTTGKSRARKLILELGSDIDLFHTPEREAFASVELNGHLQTWPVRSPDFSEILHLRYYRATGDAPPKNALEEALGMYRSRALFDGPELRVFLRVAEHDGKTYLDLANAGWTVVEIDHEGWRVIPSPPVRFRRPRGMMPLPTPVCGGNIEELRSFLNIPEDEWPLALVWLLSAYRPSGPFPVLCWNGEQGSCKSTATSVLRNLIDPNEANLRSAPRDERDLFIEADNSWVITLDNLSHIPDWLSDALCRVATGGGLATRQLYTDRCETILRAQRPISLNGISEVATRGDLLDRSVVIQLPTIGSEQRRDEREFWCQFDQVRPRLLGALLQVLSASLRQLPDVRLARKPRMADFAMFGVAVERALGWSTGRFMDLYEANRATANTSAIEASPVGLAVQALVEVSGAFEGTATDLLRELSRHKDEAVSPRAWPDSPWKLSNILRRLAPNLRLVGVGVSFCKDSGRKRARLIKLTSLASGPSGASVITKHRAEMRTDADAPTTSTDAAAMGNPVESFVSDASDEPDAPVATFFVRGEL